MKRCSTFLVASSRRRLHLGPTDWSRCHHQYRRSSGSHMCGCCIFGVAAALTLHHRALSLSELAKAFSEIGSDGREGSGGEHTFYSEKGSIHNSNGRPPSQSKDSQPPAGGRQVDTGVGSRSALYCAMGNVSSGFSRNQSNAASTRNSSTTCGQQQHSRQSQKSYRDGHHLLDHCGGGSSSTCATSSTAATTTPQFSYDYAQRLSLLDEVGFFAEMQHQHRRLQHDSMAVCLVEVWRRLRRLCVVDVPACMEPAFFLLESERESSSSYKAEESYSSFHSQQQQHRADACPSVDFCRLPSAWSHLRARHCRLSVISAREAAAEGQTHRHYLPTTGSSAFNHRPVEGDDSVDTGRHEVGTSSAALDLDTHVYCRSDRLLECVLRCLAKTNLMAMEPELRHWVNQIETEEAVKEATGQSTTTDKTSPSSHASVPTSVVTTGDAMVYEFSLLLEQWLMMRVACMDVSQCLHLLSLLSQQTLLFTEPLLATIVDTIVVKVDHVTDMNQLSELFDAIARYQALILKATRLQHFARLNRWRGSHSQGGTEHMNNRSRQGLYDTAGRIEVVGGNGDDGVRKGANMSSGYVSSLSASSTGSSFSTAFTDTTRALEVPHPVVNLHLYNAGVEQLIDRLHKAYTSQQQQQQNSSGGSVGASREIIAPTCFFFLTRALASIKLFHPGLVPAFLPWLATYLRKHPEQYLGPTLLLGRPENTAADPVVTQILLRNVTRMLQRRGEKYKGEVQVQAARRRKAEEELESAQRSMTAGNSSPSPSIAGVSVKGLSGIDDSLHLSVSGDTAATAMDVDEDAMLLLSGDGDEDDDGFDGSPLLSLAPQQQPAKAAVMGDATTTTTSASSYLAASSSSGQHSSSSVFMVSFIDIHGLPQFLCALRHQYNLSLALLPFSILAEEEEVDGSDAGTTVSRLSLSTDMLTLYKLLLDDTHRGTRSIQSIVATWPSGTVEKIIALLLETNADVLDQHSTADSFMVSPSTAIFSSSSSSSESPPHAKARINAATQRLRRDTAWHPLLVELVYVWTCQLPPRRHSVAGNTKATSYETWRKRVSRIMRDLLETGVLERAPGNRFVITPEALTYAPRVVEAIEGEKKKILARHERRRAVTMEAAAEYVSGRRSTALKQGSCTRSVVRTSAVFKHFSEAIVSMM